MTKGWHWRYNKVHMATRWTIRHGLMPLWFKDLMNITEKLQFIDPTFRRSCLVPSSPLMLWEWSWNLALPSQLVTHVFPRVKNVSCFLLRVLIGCPRRFPLHLIGPLWLIWFWFYDTPDWTALQHQSRHDHPHPVSSLAPYDVFLLFVGCFLLIALNRKVL